MLTINESERKTALTITTPRSSTRSFSNYLAPRLSTKELTIVACCTHEGTRLGGLTLEALSIKGEARMRRRVSAGF